MASSLIRAICVVLTSALGAPLAAAQDLPEVQWSGWGGTPYADAREPLAIQRFEPVHLPDAVSCEVYDFHSEDLCFPELYRCSISGGVCLFMWRKGDLLAEILAYVADTAVFARGAHVAEAHTLDGRVGLEWGMAYPEARRVLVDRGYAAITPSDRDACSSRSAPCYLELVECQGAFPGICYFGWRKGEEQIVVETINGPGGGLLGIGCLAGCGQP